MRGLRIFLLLFSAAYVTIVNAQEKNDSLTSKETWALGLAAGTSYSGGASKPLGLNSGLIARIYLKKGFISSGLLFNNFRYYLGSSLGYPYGFYNSSYHVYSIPLYYNIQSAGSQNRYYAGIGAEMLYWHSKASFNPGDLRIRYWLGAKAGLTFKSKGRFSFLLELTLKETSLQANYPGMINFRGRGYNLYLIMGTNAGLLYNF